MPEVKKYRKLPVEISAIELRAYGDFVRACNWVNENGGSAAFAKEHTVTDEHGTKVFPDHLLISTLEGVMEAGVGWFVIRGVKGEFYPCEPEIFRLTYEAVEVSQVEPLVGLIPYAVGRSDGSTRLVGGAAKRLRQDGTDGSWAGD